MTDEVNNENLESILCIRMRKWYGVYTTIVIRHENSDYEVVLIKETERKKKSSWMSFSDGSGLNKFIECYVLATRYKTFDITLQSSDLPFPKSGGDLSDLSSYGRKVYSKKEAS